MPVDRNKYKNEKDMETFKLMSMTDFVLKILNESAPNDFIKAISTIRKYADFLKQPLSLGMFVPCDDQGNVLREPEMYRWYKETGHLLKHFNEHERFICEQYQKAKEKVLFKHAEVYMIRNDKDKIKGCSYVEIKVTTLDWLIRFRDDGVIKFIDKQLKTIEDIVFMDIELTESAIKQFM